MIILKKIFRVCIAIASNPRILGAILHDNRYWLARFRKSYGHAQPLPVVNFNDLIAAETELPLVSFLGGGSTIPDLLLLRHLAAREDIHVYFEIGTWRGESMTHVLPHVDKAYSLDLDKAKMQERGFTSQVQEQMYSLLMPNQKIVLLQGDSKTFDFGSLGEKCDLIFIDGNHTYEYVLSDTKNVLAYLTHARSIIVWHDYAFDPEQIRWEVYKAILDALPSELHQRLYHVSNTKCAILWPGDSLKNTKAGFPMTVTNKWKVRLSGYQE